MPSSTRLVGVDLAWGPNGTTGLAAVDDAGVLLDVTTARTDGQLETWLAEWAPGPCLVAMDAPLVVRNPSGQRGCERLLGRHFAPYKIACHPANTANPHFADGGRAMRLAGTLGLDPDPASTGARRAIEVYPHPALVALFGLPERLRYKAKRGRDLPLLRAEMLRLLDLLESLEDDPVVPLRVRDSAPWRQVRRAVTGATRKADLGRVEDGVDAVVCAYVAAVRDRTPERTRVLGSLADGYIVTPVSPELAARIDAER